MKRLISVLLAAAMLLCLTACGDDKKPEDKVELMSSLADTSKALGYDLLAYNTSGSTLTLESTAVVNDNIGQATYQNGKSTVTLRMTLDREKAEGLAGYKNAGTAGAIEAPKDVFSKLSIQVVDNSIYFCEFTYTNCGIPCYLSLAETKTNLDYYSVLLIDYVNQLYNMEGIPSYVFSVDPSLDLDKEAPELSQEDASASAEPQKEDTQKSGEQKQESEQKEETEQKQESDQKEETEQKQESDKKEESGKKTDSEEKPKGSITLTYYDITLVHVGDAYTFEPKGGSGGYKWKSENPKVASVSESGTVKATGKGTTKVTVTSGDGLSAEVIVRVPGK